MAWFNVHATDLNPDNDNYGDLFKINEISWNSIGTVKQNILLKQHWLHQNDFIEIKKKVVYKNWKKILNLSINTRKEIKDFKKTTVVKKKIEPSLKNLINSWKIISPYHFNYERYRQKYKWYKYYNALIKWYKPKWKEFDTILMDLLKIKWNWKLSWYLKVTYAQWVIETWHWTSPLYNSSFNLFCQTVPDKELEWIDKNDKGKNNKFIKFNNFIDAIIYYDYFFKSNWYRKRAYSYARRNKNNALNFAKGIFEWWYSHSEDENWKLDYYKKLKKFLINNKLIK